MTIDVEEHAGVKLLCPKGPLTGADGKVLVDTAASLLEGDQKCLMVHLGEIPYMNSAGLGELVRLAARANMQGGRVAFVAPSELVSRVLHATGLDTFFNVLPDVDEALKTFQ